MSNTPHHNFGKGNEILEWSNFVDVYIENDDRYSNKSKDFSSGHLNVLLMRKTAVLNTSPHTFQQIKAYKGYSQLQLSVFLHS